MKTFSLLLVLFVLLFSSTAFAAGSWTVTTQEVEGFRYITANYVADAADGSLPSLTLPTFNGQLLGVRVGTGSTQPTAAYDAVLNVTVGADTVDVMRGKLQNLSQAGGEDLFAVGPDTTTYVYPFVFGAPALVVTGNSVNSATGTFVFSIKLK